MTKDKKEAKEHPEKRKLKLRARQKIPAGVAVFHP